MKRLVSASVERANLYPPGKPLAEIQREYGLKTIIKLNSNENCLGASPMALEAVQNSIADLHLYPDNSAYYLKKRLSEKLAVSPDQIIFGNGSNELVQFIAMTFLLPGEEIITASPTFVLYSIMGQVLGGRVKEIPLKDYSYDLEAIAEAVSESTKIVFISNPNNPTGTIVEKRAFEAFINRVPRDVIVVVDEAYREYVTSPDFPDTLSCIGNRDNLILLRTFSKAYGLAGLRIGYAVAQKTLIDYMEKLREPFNANHLAQNAALAALDDDDHIAKTRQNNQQGLDYLYANLNRLGIGYVPTQANFVLIHLGNRTEKVYDALFKAGIIVRSMKGWGLEDYIRVTVGLPEQNHKFIEVVEKIIG